MRGPKVSHLLLGAAALLPSVAADTPEDLASALLAQMTMDEKISMVHGTNNGNYVGNTAAISRLGIPALTMNDGPQGFRSECCPGTTTQYPAAINIAATFDMSAAFMWGNAMGEEFVTKGSNVQLGPGLNVARVPVNGRNFEYLSGEDPFLGAHMVPNAVYGIQGQKVIANAKHYVNNNQETNRQTVVEVVDERSQWELYMPPFISAIDAGVGSFMCSYNNVSTSLQQEAGTSFWACENYETLTVDLKNRMGFKGWVMSDWGATHSTVVAALAGLDQEMPSSDFFGENLKDAITNGLVNESVLDDKVLRILTAMETFGLMDSDTPTASGNIEADATSDAHREVARQLAAMSSVLLKNDNSILPLADNSDGAVKVAVLGSAAALGAISGGGGSGEVTPKHAVSLLEGIYNRFGVNASNWGNGSCTFLKNVDYVQPNSPMISDVGSQGECCDTCAVTAGCSYYTYQESSNSCWLKFDDSGFTGNAGSCVSGSSGNSQQPLSWLTYVPTGDLDAATAAATEADIVIVAVATTSSEGSDRSTLALSDDENDLVTAAASANPNTIVVANTPGAILMPWSDDVAAIVLSFMPGEQGGSGQADMLYGDVNPSARLPITIPNMDNEVGFTESQYPGVGVDEDHTFATYTEELLIGYRWYQANNVVPKYAFGHGLSYTSFTYSGIVSDGDAYTWTVSIHVANTGARDGAEVVQLYLGFPAAAQEPPMQLKGISKVDIEAGGLVILGFELTSRDFSIWDTTQHDWAVVNGTFTVSIGAASDDIRATTTIEIV